MMVNLTTYFPAYWDEFSLIPRKGFPVISMSVLAGKVQETPWNSALNGHRRDFFFNVRRFFPVFGPKNAETGSTRTACTTNRFCSNPSTESRLFGHCAVGISWMTVTAQFVDGIFAGTYQSNLSKSAVLSISYRLIVMTSLGTTHTSR